MKTLVIYYSLEGNTKFIAENIAKETGADLLALVPEKEIPSTGFRKYVWGGKSVVFKETPKLVNEAIDLSSYDRIFLGTPIWASTYAAPFNTFIRDTVIQNKQIALFACHAGGSTDKCFSQFKNALPNNQFIGEIGILDPLKERQDAALVTVRQWLQTM